MNVYRNGTKRVATALLCGVVALGLSGCMRKKVKVFVPPTNLTPVALVVPPTDELPLVDVPEVEDLPVPIAVAASRPRPRRRFIPRPNAVPTANAPPQVAAAEGLPDESAIGELTAGGDANPQRRQEATDLIASNEKRLRALSARVVNAQRSQVSKIRNFQRQAKLALDSGDAEGAMTLATKARLILQDLDGRSGM